MSTIQKQILHFPFGNCMFYNNYIEHDTYKLFMLSTVAKQSSIQKILKLVISGVCLFFIGLLFLL
jgi:hypothetical protein